LFIYKPSLPIEALFVDAPLGGIKAAVLPRRSQASAAASA
jgi:hypothetical protein